MKEPPYPIVFYLVLLAGSLVLFRESYRIEGFGSMSGPGTFPMIAAGLMILCLVSLIIRQAIAGRAPDEDSTSQRLHRIVTWPILAYIAVCALYVASLEYAGFWISSAIFLFVSFHALHAKGLPRTVVATLCSLAFVYVIFIYIFRVYLP